MHAPPSIRSNAASTAPRLIAKCSNVSRSFPKTEILPIAWASFASLFGFDVPPLPSAAIFTSSVGFSTAAFACAGGFISKGGSCNSCGCCCNSCCGCSCTAAGFCCCNGCGSAGCNICGRPCCASCCWRSGCCCCCSLPLRANHGIAFKAWRFNIGAPGCPPPAITGPAPACIGAALKICSIAATSICPSCQAAGRGPAPPAIIFRRISRFCTDRPGTFPIARRSCCAPT
mmetsp:Transcript_22339/g.36744  ORF Transcript_22339/g.36744 Transcript_22339/m.36744 type:complete len:230 (-) Transcript_22339:1063-1752(-)